MATTGYLGIDAGTQGLSVIFTDQDLNVLATGDGHYGMIAGLDEGCYEQSTTDWESALEQAMADLRDKLAAAEVEMDVQAIGISGQMHGEVLADERGEALAPVRLWCDRRNEAEGDELTDRFGVKMPKRITTARWLWTVRNQPEKAKSVARMTTPAGWLAYRLTGEWKLGIGDAAGMFPIDQETLNYDQKLLESFDELVASAGIRPLSELLPEICRVGQDGGSLADGGASMLGLPAGIPVAPAEGDQPAALAGSLIGAAGMVSVSFGTSVCANSVGDRGFQGVSNAVDHFCAPDGKPINMVWLRNGTTFMNTVVEMFGEALGGERSAGFAAVMPKVLQAAPDCGGILALPFMDDEPGLGVSQGGKALLFGMDPDNSTPGNTVKAALLATMFNLRLGSQILDQQGFPRTELVLSGGLTKSPELAQVLADVFDTPVTLLAGAEEGTAMGAALMARFRHEKIQGSDQEWTDFLNRISTTGRKRFEPDPEAVTAYEQVFDRYQTLLKVFV